MQYQCLYYKMQSEIANGYNKGKRQKHKTAEQWDGGNQLIHTNMRKFKGGQIYPFDALNDQNLSVQVFLNRLKREHISLRTKLVISFNWGKINTTAPV